MQDHDQGKSVLNKEGEDVLHLLQGFTTWLCFSNTLFSVRLLCVSCIPTLESP